MNEYKKTTETVKSQSQKLGIIFLLSILGIGVIVLAFGIYSTIINQQLLSDLNYNHGLWVFPKAGGGTPFQLLPTNNYNTLLSIFNDSLIAQAYLYIVIGAILLFYSIFKIVSSRRRGIVSLYIYDYLVVILLVVYVLAVSISFAIWQFITRGNLYNPSDYVNNNQFVIHTGPAATSAIGDGNRYYSMLNLITGANIGYVITAVISFGVLTFLFTISILVMTGKVTSINIKLTPTGRETQMLLDYKPKLGYRQNAGLLGQGKTKKQPIHALEHKKTKSSKSSAKV